MPDRIPSRPGKYHGRLELTWTNKDEALLWAEDGSYRWVPPTDYRVAEVRLLHDAGEVGKVGPKSRRAADNLLIRGDALNALTSLARLPEFQREYLGKVKLAYLDPPFNTQQAFEQYDDALEHSVWLTMMRDRLVQIKRLLREDGSVWVHLDDSEMAYCRVVMDEIFGRECFVTTFVWQKVDSPNTTNVPVTPDHEYIVCYGATSAALRTFEPMPHEKLVEAYGSIDENGRPYRDRLLKKNGKNSLRTDRPSMFFEIEGPDGKPVLPIHDDGREARWSLGKEEVKRRATAGELVWKLRQHPSLGERWVPYTREWAPPSPTRPWPTIWTDVFTTRQAKAHLTAMLPGVTPFETPKPETLIARVVQIASRPGDIVLDCFLGSGTTAAVAHKMGRRWVGVERSADTLSTYAIPRLEKVVAGQDPGGITEAVSWQGGGGFRILDVSPSMFTESNGYVVLADWAVNGRLAEATAAQLGYEFRFDPPFCGVRGRSLLAVVDGLVTTDVVDVIASRLEESERAVICGTAIADDAAAALTAISPGSRVRRIPASILAEYRLTNRRFFRPRDVRPVQPPVHSNGSAEERPVTEPSPA